MSTPPKKASWTDRMLDQRNHVLHWMANNQAQRPAEYGCFVAAMVVLGAAGFMLSWWLHFAFIVMPGFAPEIYAWVRSVLHRWGMLRCDWLPAVRPH